MLQKTILRSNNEQPIRSERRNDVNTRSDRVMQGAQFLGNTLFWAKTYQKGAQKVGFCATENEKALTSQQVHSNIGSPSFQAPPFSSQNNAQKGAPETLALNKWKNSFEKCAFQSTPTPKKRFFDMKNYDLFIHFLCEKFH